MSTYLFQLGSFPELSLAELEAVLPEKPMLVLPELARVSLDSSFDMPRLMESLGGTVKILQQVEQLTSDTPETISQAIVEYLVQDAQTEDKISFCVSELGRDHLPPIEIVDIKNSLIEKGFKARYREGSRHGLSAAVLTHTSKFREIYVIQASDKSLYVAETVVAQPIDDWSERDRSKPYADRKKGMLPPKVARIMVNLALGRSALTSDGTKVVFDPFCGSGTILMEAALSGAGVVGSDLDPHSVHGTQENLKWLTEQTGIKIDATLLQADATKVLPPNASAITHLISEPFLGKPKPRPPQLPNIFRGLERMYLGSFKHWTTFLPDGAKLVIIFPYVQISEKRSFSLEKLIDKLAEFGYTITSPTLLYARPQAVVQRQIVQLVYKNNTK